MLEVRTISKSFGGLMALDKINLQVKEGQVMGIIGSNGAGKTTLFNIISGFLKPDKGMVLLDGGRLDHLSPNQVVRRGVGRTFQVTKIFKNFSVLDNLRVVCSEKQAIIDSVNYVQLDKLLDRQAGLLSLFEQKRLELTMALVLRPRLLLMDEVSSGLSLSEKNYFKDVIARIKRDLGPAIVLIEHDVKVALELSDRLTVLYNGYVLASGDPISVVRDDKVVDNYLGRMAV
ncbi:MAG: ABC transporter ATP-binding protein [Candidatus Tectomicrobia bacterium]|uniref:ABC transporter ATP-binding protein n=1 Tax=Tectimicrobiota bacterium TaxID=2528274 RepID=A0A933LPL6_UNCTE|nr:ABC transporter ATP-binding protein [Candidatus Tectomicrobia bacterium]